MRQLQTGRGWGGEEAGAKASGLSVALYSNLRDVEKNGAKKPGNFNSLALV